VFVIFQSAQVEQFDERLLTFTSDGMEQHHVYSEASTIVNINAESPTDNALKRFATEEAFKALSVEESIPTQHKISP
jgi:hypothetical protein